MKKIFAAALIAISCMLTGCAYTDYLRNHVFTATGGAVSGSPATAAPKEEEPEPPVSSVSGAGIVTADLVTADMQKASYWISRTMTAERMILSPDEISEWNKKYNNETKAESDAADNTPFLIVTGNKLSAGGKIYGMGDKIFLLTDELKERWIKEHGQEDCTDTYLADPLSFPKRSVNIPITIPVSEEVHPGYLEYTKANVLNQAFQYLGTMYLTDEEEAEDTNTEFVKRVYSCFGFNLPDKRDAYTALGDKSVDVSKMSAQEKTEKLNSTEPGTLLDFSGNIGIYLGCIEQKHYAIGYFGYTCSIREITTGTPKNQPDEHTWLTDLTKIYQIN